MTSFLARVPLLFTLMIVAWPASARPILYSGKTVTIAVAPMTQTILRFDKPVRTVTNATAFVIGPTSEDAPDYAELMVEPRSSNASGYVNFILADGTVVRTKLIARLGENPGDNLHDIRVDVPSPEPTAGPVEPRKVELQAMDLMKAIIRGDKVMGYEVRDARRSIVKGVGVRGELVKVYTGEQFNGYVFKLSNPSHDKTFEVDIRKLRLGEPNLAVLSQIDDKVLAPGVEGVLLRIVARPGAVYRDVVLPVAPVKTQKGGEP